MISIVCPIMIDEDSGGGTKSTISLMNGLARKNELFKIYIILNPNCNFINQFDKNINISYFPSSKIISIKRPIHFLKTSLFIKHFFKSFNTNSTIAFCSERPILMIMPFLNKKIPIFYVSRGWFYDNLSAKYLTEFMFPRVKKFICISDKQNGVISNFVKRKDDIHTIYNGFEFTDKKFIPFQNNSKIKLSTIGVICKRKAQLQCLEMLNELINQHNYKNIELQIFGKTLLIEDKKYEKKILDYINKNQLTNYVKFMGHETNLEKIYKNSDLVISSAIEEGFGRTIIEAMNYGIPIIANINAGGPASIITNNHDGFLYNGTTHNLVECVIQIIENQNLRNQIILNGILTAKNKFSSENMIENYSKLILNYIINQKNNY